MLNFRKRKLDFRGKMNQNSTIVFICEHGAAKSIIAATYFNQLAQEMGLSLQSMARGTNPADKLSDQTVKGLSEDGLTPIESVPQKLRDEDLRSAQRVVTFCELPAEYHQNAVVECWEDIPPVSENYAQARDLIVARIRQMLDR
jgi:protein-tyrosine-phosphatase